MKALEEDQKRRATRSLRDGLDRILTDLLSLYRDVLLTAMHSGTELVNFEQQAQVERLAGQWSEQRALGVIDAIETARMRLARGVTPGLVLEAMFAAIVAELAPNGAK